MRMRKFILLAAMLLGGCSRYTQVEMNLAEQARRGVAIARQSAATKDDVVQRYHALQRKQLDDAFDADVRDRADLSTDWVIEARRAYATGLDALSTENLAAELSADAERSTLDAADVALQRLKWLQSIRSKWETLAEGGAK
jgi:hypothetical protein